ncbi:MAG: MobT family relaxase [Oscillospiraceae bacterium]
MNEETSSYADTLKNKRKVYGISQNKLAVTASLSRQYISEVETGKTIPPADKQELINTALEKLNPEAPLTMLFDYVRIRFPTLDVMHIVQDVLKLNLEYMLHEDYGFYSYTEHYVMGDIFVLTSPDLEKGVLLELKGQGCRQMESYLEAQERSWHDFLLDCLVEGGVIKRLDLAINDMAGILNIPELTEKSMNEECVSVFRTFKSYRSGELVKSREQDKLGMGNTLYIGSLKSEVYFCIYEKDYEQYVKYGIPIEDTPVKNRFEIRLKNDRAYYAVKDLLTYQDAERTAFDIINRYIRFADKDENKERSDWETSASWQWFLGADRGRLRLTTKPEPYTYQRTLHWLNRQVAPTLKMAMKLDKLNGTDYIDSMLEQAKLTEKHEKILQQQSAQMQDIITKESEE